MKKIKYISLAELHKNKGYINLTYLDFLSTLEWKKFRDEIVRRDNWKCQKCSVTPSELAWESLNSSPFKIYTRLATKFERQTLGVYAIESSTPTILNVHHKYYIEKKLPWEYNQEALITVCAKCHTDIHKNQNILIYKDESLQNSKLTSKCLRCNVTGYLDQFHYNMNGICFKCNGTGINEKLFN